MDNPFGIFEAIKRSYLRYLDSPFRLRYQALLGPTVALSRHIFKRPTHAYKTGIVFLAYLNDHQSHFRMLGGAESARTAVHLGDLIRLVCLPPRGLSSRTGYETIPAYEKTARV